MNIKNKIQEKSGVGMTGLIVSLTIFSAILVGFTTWYINLNNNVAITGERMEEMSIAYDRWNQIINEDFDSLKERVDKISGRTESKLISNKYDLTIAYGSEGKFINGECVDGQAADDEQRCIPVSISVKNRNAIAGVASKPYSLSTTRVASQGSGGDSGFPDWNKGYYAFKRGLYRF